MDLFDEYDKPDIEQIKQPLEQIEQRLEQIEATEEKKIEEDCTCEANLFYKQYKDQIDQILKKRLTSLRGSAATKELKQSRVGSRKSRGTSDGKSQSVGFKASRFGRVERLPSSSSDDVKEYEGDEEGTSDKDKDKDKDIREEESTWEDMQKIGWDKKKLGLDKTSKDIDYFLKQLSRKMDKNLLEGEEGESMGLTDRGYYIFERFSQSIGEPADTICKISTFPSTVEEEQEEYYSFHLPYTEEEFMSESMRRALEYLNRHHISELFRYLGAQLVSNKPCNPIDFLINLLDHCMNYRSGFCQPPLLYMPKHLESLFNSMDPMKTEEIDINQYHTAMLTLGIKNYNHYPQLNMNGMVDKDTFLNEAFIQLKILLDEMIKSDEPVILSGYTAFYPSIQGGESIK